MKAGLTIGELAEELHLNPRTIRYYEEVGLMPAPRRSESGYRLYSKDEIERLRLVRRSRLLGLSLAEIKEIVDYATHGHCSLLQDRLLSLVRAKLDEIDERIRDLVTLRGDMRRYQGDLERGLQCAGEEHNGVTAASCQCVGQEVDSIGKGIHA